MILHGDCLQTLPTLPAESVQCCITSPPYFALRDYGVDGQHGLEAVHDCLGWATGAPCGTCFVCTMVAVFRQVHRVLKPDGTLWLNLGDSTASSGGNGAGGNAGRVGRAFQQRNVRPIKPQRLAPKNLLGIPWRVALALQADGWILRQDIIWHKKTPMPETAKDRPTRAHEYLFLLVKQRFYYYDAAAIAEPCSPGTHARMAQNIEAQQGSLRANGGTDPRPMRAGGRRNPPVGQATREAQRGARKATLAVPTGWDTRKGSHRELQGRYQPRVKNNPDFDATIGTSENPTHRNKRSVWTLGPEPFKGAHFATFPESLVQPCILAGTRPGDVVLDPYMGSGTTAAVAQRLGRNWVGCELKPAYAAIAEERIHRTQAGLALT